MEKSKAEKSPWIKKRKKKKNPAQRRKKYLHFAKERSNLNLSYIRLKRGSFIIHLLALIQKHKQSPRSVLSNNEIMKPTQGNSFQQ